MVISMYKVEIKATDYPNTPLTVRLLSTGDTIFIKDPTLCALGIGIAITPPKFIRCFMKVKNGGSFGRRKSK